MLNSARHSHPALLRRVLWLALLIALPVAVASVVVLVASAVTTSSGGGSPRPAPVAVDVQAQMSCAGNDRAAVLSVRPGAGSTVVPQGPTAALLCRYSPATHGELQAHRLITDEAMVTRLARDLDALPAGTGSYACPLDDGEVVIAHFLYPSGALAVVQIGLSGCQTVTNGQVHRLGLDKPVIGRISALVR